MIAFSLEALDEQLLPIAGWLGTFALHSTVALAVTWMFVRMRGRRSLGLQDTALRQAMWVPFVSATLQSLFFGSMWDSLLVSPTVTTDELAPLVGMLVSDAHVGDVAAVVDVAAATPWATIVVGVAAGMAAFGLVWLFRTWRRLTHILAMRRPETDARVLSAAAKLASGLGLRQSPHISRAQGLSTPIAFGFLRPEICLPARVASLDEASLHAMLGHELAHLRRADPAWMWLGAWIHALFPWQLLLLATRREWSRVVELRCDAEAARQTSPTAVARCLVEVAEWLRPEPQGSVVALGMAARPSALRERVEAALGSGEPVPARRFAAGCMATLSLTTLTMAAPGMGEQVLTGLGADQFLSAFADETSDSTRLLQPFMTMVEQEYAALVIEARQLQTSIHLSTLPQPQAMELQSLLQERMARLSQLRTRLLVRVSRDSSPNR